jgi:hypothetical protein
MSLGHLGAMCGCGFGQLCGDCQASRPMEARWAVPTNYETTAHRRYVANANLPGMGAVLSHRQTNPMIYQRPQAPGMGEVMIGSSGWTLGDVASLALVVLAGMSVWKGMNGRRH